MAGTIGIVTGTGALRSGVTLLARIRGASGELITQDSLSAITYTVRDLTEPETIATGQTLTVSAVVYDNLQQHDPRWDKDSAARPGPDGEHGFNFAATIPASSFTAYDVGAEAPFVVEPHTYQIDVKFTPVSGQVFWQSFVIKTTAVYGS